MREVWRVLTKPQLPECLRMAKSPSRNLVFGPHEDKSLCRRTEPAAKDVIEGVQTMSENDTFESGNLRKM